MYKDEPFSVCYPVLWFAWPGITKGGQPATAKQVPPKYRHVIDSEMPNPLQNLLKFPAPNYVRDDEGKVLRREQKPVEAYMEFILRDTTLFDDNPPPVVVDMFGGSGTIAEAALRTGRHFVYNDRDEQAYLQAVARAEVIKTKIQKGSIQIVPAFPKVH